MSKKTTSDALEIVDRLLIGDDPALRMEIELARDKIRIGQLAYKAREQAGMTRVRLAKILGLTEEDIFDLEDGGFDGDAFKALSLIANAVGKKVELELVNA